MSFQTDDFTLSLWLARSLWLSAPYDIARSRDLKIIFSNNTEMLFVQFCWIAIWLPRRSPLSTHGGKFYFKNEILIFQKLVFFYLSFRAIHAWPLTVAKMVVECWHVVARSVTHVTRNDRHTNVLETRENCHNVFLLDVAMTIFVMRETI